MCFVSARSNNAAAEDFSDNLRGLTGTVDTIVSKLIRGKTLRMESAEAGFVTKERAAGHGHAAREQDFDGRIEPEDGGTGGAEKLRAAGLGIGAPTESEDRAFLEFGSAAESRAELIGFHLAESRFAEALENLRNGEASRFFDALVKIDETPGELASQESSDGGFAGTHEAGETQELKAGLRPAQMSW
jgi:hypothetical protein